MATPDVLARIQAAGIHLKPLPDGRLWVEPRSRLTEELRSLIVEHKAELLAALDSANDPVDPAISKKKAELTRLVGIVAEYHGFNPADTAEALDVAKRDIDGWLIEFRLLAAEIPTPEPHRDDRITCSSCGELAGNGRCQAARDRRMKDASPDYSPVLDMPRRCEFYKPKAKPQTRH